MKTLSIFDLADVVAKRLDLVDVVAKKIDEETIVIDLGGHNRSNDLEFSKSNTLNKNKEYLKHQLSYGPFSSLLQEDLAHLIKIVKGKKKPSKFFALKHSCLFTCFDCGKEIELEFNGKEFRCKNPCEYPDGLVYEIELNVPSGKMVVANDLRNWWRVVGSYNVNNHMGCCLTTKRYAEAGMAHAFVGNTCPSVYRIRKDKFVIGVNNGRKNPVKGARTVASVCTDLWWYSIVDYNDFVSRMKSEPGKYREDVVECKPGVYRFKHVYHLQDRNDYENPQVFTEIDWVREPDTVVDHKAHYDNLNLTAGQIIADSMIGWKRNWRDESDDKSEVAGIQFCIDHVMCVNGNGYDYHKNGFLVYNPDLNNDSPSIKIPVLAGKYHWYPFSEDSFIMKAALGGKNWYHDEEIVLNESFVDLAFNVLHCISKYGVLERPGWGNQENIIKLAKKGLDGLVERYPKLIPDYVKTYFASR